MDSEAAWKTADPDQLADLELHCFQMMIYLGSAGQGLKLEKQEQLFLIFMEFYLNLYTKILFKTRLLINVGITILNSILLC